MAVPQEPAACAASNPLKIPLQRWFLPRVSHAPLLDRMVVAALLASASLPPLHATGCYALRVLALRTRNHGAPPHIMW